MIPFWNCVIGGELEELDDGRVVENVRVAAAGVDIAVIPREARAKGGLIWVARACALFRLLGVQDKLSGTLQPFLDFAHMCAKSRKGCKTSISLLKLFWEILLIKRGPKY